MHFSQNKKFKKQKNQKIREELSDAIKDLKYLLLIIHDPEVEAKLKDLESQH